MQSTPWDPPRFMGNGTFLWDRRGYSFTAPPPLDLTAPEALDSTNGWLVTAAALERAKLGDHGAIERLAGFIDPEAPPLLVRACVDLLGDAGAEKHLNALASLMLDGIDAIRAEACWGARWAGSLWLVPFMLEAWLKVERIAYRDSIGASISELIEEEPGPLLSIGQGYSNATYKQLVDARVKDLNARLGSDLTPLWHGQRFGVMSLAQHMRQALLNESEDPHLLRVEFTTHRHRFEASTGVDCSRFFGDRQFKPLNALAVLEDFLRRTDASAYEEGRRYFYGHRVPDE